MPTRPRAAVGVPAWTQRVAVAVGAAACVGAAVVACAAGAVGAAGAAVTAVPAGETDVTAQQPPAMTGVLTVQPQPP